MLSAFKNFLVTFLVGAILFSVVGFFTTKFVSGVVTGIIDGEKDKLEGIMNDPANTIAPTDDPAVPTDNEKVPDGDSFTAVFVGTDFDPETHKDYYLNEEYLNSAVKDVENDEDALGILETRLRYTSATWIVLLRADKEAREFAACYFTPETKITTPIGEATLGEVYGRYGMDVVCEYLNTLTGLEIDYRFVIDDMNCDDFLESMETVEFELGCDIYSGGRYHVSAEYRDELDPAATLKPLSTPSLKSEEPDEEEETAETGENKTSEETKKNEKTEETEDPEETKDSDEGKNVRVLGKGTQELSDYSVSILNTFKEFSTEDINVKSKYILEILKAYLEKCAEMSDSDFAKAIKSVTGGNIYDFEDPYSDKPVLGTDLTEDKLSNVHSMLEALEYFGYTQFVYPGSYAEDTNYFTTDVQSGREMFIKYGTNAE